MENFLTYDFSSDALGQIEIGQRQNDPKLNVKLAERDLWDAFDNVGTEMIITKTGRRMFPGIKVNISGMEPHEKYVVILDFANVDEKRYKFSDGEWKLGGRCEPNHPKRFFIHPDSPNTGDHWQQKTISFRGAKLTNNLINDPNMIVLNSMHKYRPRVHVIKCSSLSAISSSPFSTFDFPKTSFIAVTAYQNTAVTKLKIAHNPFAKGFRERAPAKKRSANQNASAPKRPRSLSPSSTNQIPIIAHENSWSSDSYTIPVEYPQQPYSVSPTPDSLPDSTNQANPPQIFAETAIYPLDHLGYQNQFEPISQFQPFYTPPNMNQYQNFYPETHGFTAEPILNQNLDQNLVSFLE
ncbi:Oidioi.mRNA.OKI2018_I69.chr1.g163.t1.cds [Oikopleura dioica]|uniref:Oidioi.mRNA.OKI2018_I69.chr1.g163.t1.cds n=1 Tax=Oikopleura dioica TaxID=34765 RepID=A0ABN7SN84_OIKDI|nr:Oidioi.mRNA.OKI2018_I69.chr1.g163.t1.cds [Oikopleura dioica]